MACRPWSIATFLLLVSFRSCAKRATASSCVWLFADGVGAQGHRDDPPFCVEGPRFDRHDPLSSHVCDLGGGVQDAFAYRVDVVGGEIHGRDPGAPLRAYRYS